MIQSRILPTSSVQVQLLASIPKNLCINPE